MNQHKMYRCLMLIVLLSDGKFYSIDQLSLKLNLTQRSTYRYMEMLKTVGFEVIKQSSKYQLNPGIVPQTIKSLLQNGN